jgi:sodium/bile acid cotransporter 7
MLVRLIPDRFVLLLVGAVLLGWFLPARGAALDALRLFSTASIFTLFFLHGLRLPRAEVRAAARGWKLQGAMLFFVFGAMPLAGLLLSKAVGWMLPAVLSTGVLYCAILPSTVQSAISYSSMAGGNVAASVVGAAVSNLAGILLTPVLAALVLGATSAVSLSSDVFVRIATMLLLPFALGQAGQQWLGNWAQRRKAMLSFFDRMVILIAVYVAFAAAMASGSMASLDLPKLTLLGAMLALLLAFAFAGSWGMGALLGLNRADRISLTFSGAHKSIATGAPMAAILFGSGAGLVVLPVIIYHMMQLLASAPLAARLAKGS